MLCSLLFAVGIVGGALLEFTKKLYNLQTYKAQLRDTPQIVSPRPRPPIRSWFPGCKHGDDDNGIACAGRACAGVATVDGASGGTAPAERAREDEKLYGQRTSVAPCDVPSQVVRPVALRPALSGSVR